MDPVTVLLVDDHQPWLDIVTRFLKEHCLNEVAVVGTARGAEDGLAHAQRLRPDVILLDLRMPGMSGLEAIPRLRRLVPGTGIIALTLLTPGPYRIATLAAGADGFVSKDTLYSDLLPTIQRVAQANRSRAQRVDSDRSG